MKFMDWQWLIIETPKYFFITYGILGFDFKEGKKKYLWLIYLLIFPFLFYLKMDTFLYKRLWLVLAIVAFFHGSLKKKVQIFFLEYSVIGSVDVFFWCLFLTISSVDRMQEGTMGDCLTELFTMIIWIFPLFLLKKQRKRIHECILLLSWKWIFLLIGTFVICGLVLGAEKGRILGEMTKADEQIVAFIGDGAVVAVIIMVIVLIYTVYYRERFKREQELKNYILKEQQAYYDQIMQQEEETRSFRHDIQNHLRIIATLEQKGEVDKSQQYLMELIGKLGKGVEKL